MKRVAKDIIIFCAVFIAAVIFLGSVNFTGNVTWTDTSLNNCSDAQIQSYWDSIFTRLFDSSVTIQKINQNDGYCDEFIAYNYSADSGNLNGSFYVLYSDIWNNTWNSTELYTSPDGDYRILENITTNALYFNVSQEFMDNFYTLGFDEKISALSNIAPGNITNWSLTTENDVDNKLAEHFEANIFSDISWSKPADWSFSNDSSNPGKNSSSDDYNVLENKSVIIVSHVITRYDPTYYVNLTGIIPNQSFETNTNWEYAFNISDYFNVSDDNNITIDFSADSNNSDGEYINGSIGVYGNVSFKANGSFAGSREFELKVVSPSGVNTSSNTFNVTFNMEPNQTQDIENFYIVNGTTESIDLDDYFSDYDNQTLNYSIHGSVYTIDVDITGSTLEIGLGENFGTYESLKIDVFDGFSSIISNRFYVYEDDGGGATQPPAGGADDEQPPTEDGSGDSGDEREPEVSTSSNNVNQISDTTDPKKVLRTVLWGFLGLVVLAIIAIIIMIFLKSKSKKRTGYPPKKQTATIQTRPRPPQQVNNRPPLRQVVPNRGAPGAGYGGRGRPPFNARPRR